MSRLEQTAGDRKTLRFFCPRCWADPGEWCCTPSQQWAARLHAVRRYVADTTPEPK